MNKRKPVYLALLWAGVALLACWLLLRGNPALTNPAEGALIGVGSGLFAMGLSNLLMLRWAEGLIRWLHGQARQGVGARRQRGLRFRLRRLDGLRLQHRLRRHLLFPASRQGQQHGCRQEHRLHPFFQSGRRLSTLIVLSYQCAPGPSRQNPAVFDTQRHICRW